jgi:hypothetical protein
VPYQVKVIPTMKEQTTVIKGLEAFMKFAAYLAERCKSIETPCEGFATMQLGPFEGEISGISIVELTVGGEHPPTSTRRI